MGELGEYSDEAHRRVGGQATLCDFQGLFLFGEQMGSAYKEIKKQAFRGTVEWMTDLESLRTSLRSYLREGDLLLIKGSRVAEMERLMPDFGAG